MEFCGRLEAELLTRGAPAGWWGCQELVENSSCIRLDNGSI